MDSVGPEGERIHKVEFNLMGTLAMLPNYKLGDWVNYGGMVYKPVVSGSMEMIHSYPDGVSTNTWGCTGPHKAGVWSANGKDGFSFYCS